MEHPLTCPLCSHPGFANVDSLRLALISATSRRLVCPVCQDILQGLDKLTIHLVSHSLHDHLLRASFASSISTSPLALTQNNIQDLQAEASQHSLNICNDTNQSQLNIPFLIGAGGMHGCLAQMEVSNMSSSAETLTNSASYILINLPPPQTIKGGINTNTSDIAPTENVHIMTSAVCPEKEVTSYETDNFTEAREILSKPVLIAPQKTNQNDPETEEVTNSVSHNPIPPSGILFVQQSVIGNRTSQTNIEKQTERLGQETQRAGLLSSEGTSVEEANAFLVPSECEDVHMSEEFHSLQERSNNSEVLLSCKVCGIHFKDSRISMLHYQLVHDKNAEEIGVIQSEAPHPSQKRYSWNSRQKTNCFDGTERDNTCSPHRFPCHMCPKVFRMRGSLMVHLRVAHTSASIGRIVDGSSAGNSGATAMVQSLKDCQPLDTFTIPSREYSYNVHRAISSFQNPEESSVSCAGASGPSSSVSALSQASSVMSSASRTNSAIECSSLSTLASEPAPCSSFATGCSDKTLSNIVMASHHVDTLIPHNSSAPSLQESPSPPSPPITSSPATGNDSSNTSMGSNFICTVCNKTFSQESVLAQHVKAHEGKQWECDVCTKLFTTKYFLKKHKRLHTGEMPYTCATCNKSFTFQQSYHKHLLYHSDEKPHTCAECGRSFKELSTLHNHQRIHTGEKPWACETCGKCFRQRVSYLVHRRIHTGAMPYRCTACDKSFRYKVSQRTHKCTAQTPGEVVCESGDLLQSLLVCSNIQSGTAVANFKSQQSMQVAQPKYDHEGQQILKEQLQQLCIKQEQHQYIRMDCQQSQRQDQRLQHFVEQAQQFLLQRPSGEGEGPIKGNEFCEEQVKEQTHCNTIDHHSVTSAHHRREQFQFNVQNSKETTEHTSLGYQSQEHNWHVQKQQNVQYHVTQQQTEPYSMSKDKVNNQLADQKSVNSLDNDSYPQSSSLLKNEEIKSSPTGDASGDILQDILSMVMSPSMNNAPSPSEQLQQLSLSSSVSNDDSDASKVIWDAEPGTELRRLLYGTYDDSSQ